MAEDKTRSQSNTPQGDAPQGDAPERRDAPKQNAPDRGGTREDEEKMATTNNDPLLRDRRQMYGGFIKFSIYGAVAVAIVLIALAIFLL